MVDPTHPKCPKLSPRRDGPTDVAPLQVRAISSGTSVPLLGSACTPMIYGTPWGGYAERPLVILHPIRRLTNFPNQLHYANSYQHLRPNSKLSNISKLSKVSKLSNISKISNGASGSGKWSRGLWKMEPGTLEHGARGSRT